MTRTADLTTSKILWNSIISTINAKYMCVDIKQFYLCTLLDKLEYMHAHTIVNVPRTNHKAVQLKIEGTEWMCLN